MLRLSARPACFAVQRQNGGQRFSNTAATTAGSARKPASILSRLSDRPRRKRRGSDAGQPDTRAEAASAAQKRPRSRATSFVSTRSAHQRDHAAEKWFTDVRELDIDTMGRSDDLKSLSRKKRTRTVSQKQHEMRPRTDLNTLFASSSRLQAKKELGGDYTKYLPKGIADPHQLPVDYARLVLGRNKHIPLSAQTGALGIIEQAIRGRTTRQASATRL